MTFLQVVETGQVSLSGAYVDLHGAAPATAATPSGSGVTLLSDPVFEEIKRRASNAAVAKKVKAVIGYEITKGGKVAKTWSEFIHHQIAKQHLAINSIKFSFNRRPDIAFV